jgi:hypothetical protein
MEEALNVLKRIPLLQFDFHSGLKNLDAFDQEVLVWT